MTEPIVQVAHLTHRFRLNRRDTLRAVDDVSFTIERGEILGLVGESGSGKSTLARCLMNVYTPTGGSVLYDGVDVLDRRAFRAHRKKLQTERQMIFQDSADSLNPRMKVLDLVAEPLVIHRRRVTREEVAFQLARVGLDETHLEKYPGELSGGQRQRVCIARALIAQPSFVVADEPVASLDVSIQAQIVNLFRSLQREQGFTFLFIAHDLTMVRYLCQRTGVMLRGRLVELAPTAELFKNPLHPYTQALLAAIPYPDPIRERARVLPDFESLQYDLAGELAQVAPGHYLLTKGGSSE